MALGDLYQHTKAKHGKKAARDIRKLMPRPELSLGDELAEAAIAWRCDGTEPPDYLRAMFPDHFPNRRAAAYVTDNQGEA